MKKVLLSVIALIVISATIKYNFDAVNAQVLDEVVVDSGTDYEYTVPADSTNKVETGLSNLFVQSEQTSYNFRKDVLKGLSSYVGLEINSVIEISGGNFLVAVSESNKNTAFETSGVHIERGYLLKVNASGEVLEYINVANGNHSTSFSWDTKYDNSSMDDKTFVSNFDVYNTSEGAAVYYEGYNLSGVYGSYVITFENSDLTNPVWHLVTDELVTQESKSYYTFDETTNKYKKSDKIALLNPTRDEGNLIYIHNFDLVRRVSGVSVLANNNSSGVITSEVLENSKGEIIAATDDTLFVWATNKSVKYSYSGTNIKVMSEASNDN